jgi:hypothetical protein
VNLLELLRKFPAHRGGEVVTEGGVPEVGSGCRCGRHAAAKTGVYLGQERAMDEQLVQARMRERQWQYSDGALDDVLVEGVQSSYR